MSSSGECITCARAARADDWICHKKVIAPGMDRCPVRVCRTCRKWADGFLGTRRVKEWCTPCNALHDAMKGTPSCSGCTLPLVNMSTVSPRHESMLLAHLQRLTSTRVLPEGVRLVRSCSLCDKQYCAGCQDVKLHPLPYCSSIKTANFCGSTLNIATSSVYACEDCSQKDARLAGETVQGGPGASCCGCGELSCEPCLHRCSNSMCTQRYCQSCAANPTVLDTTSDLCFAKCMRKCRGCEQHFSVSKLNGFGCGHLYCAACSSANKVAHACARLNCPTNMCTCRKCTCYSGPPPRVCNPCYAESQRQLGFLFREHVMQAITMYVCEDLAKLVLGYVVEKDQVYEFDTPQHQQVASLSCSQMTSYCSSSSSFDSAVARYCSSSASAPYVTVAPPAASPVTAPPRTAMIMEEHSQQRCTVQ